MTPRRALTLIETLAATVLLALLAAVCIPMLRHMTALRSDRSASIVDLAAMTAIAQLVLAQPERFGWSDEHGWPEQTIPWPDVFRESFDVPIECPPVQLLILRATDEEVDRVWLVFTCEDQSIVRCQPLPKHQQEQSSP